MNMKTITIFLFFLLIGTLTHMACSKPYVNPQTSKAISEEKQLQEAQKQNQLLERIAVAIEKNNMVGLKDAMVSLKHELAKDKSQWSYYYVWQATIAMAFIDEFTNHEFGGRIDIPKNDLHEIANNAAKNFLDQLIK